MLIDASHWGNNVRTGRYRLVIAALLFALGMINYTDRAAVGILAPQIQQDLHISSSQLGWVFSAFFFSYAIFSFLGGYLSDRLGPKRTFSAAVASWSVFCAATGAVFSLWSLISVRLLFGASEGPMNSTTNRMVTNWFPRKETARALGFTLSGQNLGSAVAAPLVIFLSYFCGWRMAFICLGAIGAIWCVLWLIFASDRPAENRHVSAQELAHIISDRSEGMLPKGSAPVQNYIFRKTTLGLALGLFSLLYPLYIFVSWMPSYFTNVMHVTQAGLSLAAGIPWVGGFLGYFLGGFISDLYFKRSTNGLIARKITTIIPLVFAALTLCLTPYIHSVTGDVMLFTLSLFAISMGIQSLWAMIHEVTPVIYMGTVGGFIHFLANMSGVIAPALTGYVIEHVEGGYTSAFWIAAGIGIFGALIMLILIQNKRIALHANTSSTQIH
ncbi:MFS transporter [Gluconobacter wancherniae]|uniref:MFS transporter n=1 Tax=Gluconobacter wancherniae TaxID=1307955 RepID=UPI001B8B27F7|nr:MFS transporter [Gluconobacter wancherniae]